ncbi:DUF4215 domain-containing protein, partial [Candidatus Peregrinibacteria bacterium]|nr:DUF4215 domain-containing protein [Candidatus Peregrinibacteria bacterium]
MKTPHIADAFLSLLCVTAIAVLTIIQIQWMPGNFPNIKNGRIAYGYHVQGTDHCAGGAANGTKASLEGCDDNNSTNGDGCSSVCMVESGWTCDSASPSICQKCGNGTKEGTEGCDDGNTTASDGCSATCAVETGYTCNSASPNVCSATCGDGLKKGSEGCDDSNATSGDGCSATCAVETGYTCTGEPSTCNKCGNSVVAGGEGCDDGNTTNSDGCSSTCTVESGYTCTGEPSTCKNKGIGGGGGGGVTLPPPILAPPTPPPPCGNGIREPEKCEECDNGRANGTSNCAKSCRLLYCGDGSIATHLREECEGRIEEERGEDPVTRATVSSFWFVTASCGISCTMPRWTQKKNGTWEYATETGCKRDLSLPPCRGEITERRVRVRPPFSCTTSPSSASSSPSSSVSLRPLHCGDGLLQTKEGEQCDRLLYDKAVVQRIEKTLYGCSPDCQISYCGDGAITPYAPLNEECDPEHPTYKSLLCAPNDRTRGCTKECRLSPLPPCIPPPPQLEQEEFIQKIDELLQSIEGDVEEEMTEVEEEGDVEEEVTEMGEEEVADVGEEGDVEEEVTEMGEEEVADV